MIAFCQSQAGGAESHHLRENVLMIAKEFPQRIRERGIVRAVTAPSTRLREAKHGELLRITHAQVAQANRVKQLKDGRVGADAQSKCQHRNCSKAWTAGQRADPVPQIAEKYFQP